MRVTITDIRAAGFCVDGARRWFAAHGLDFRHFLKNGIAVEDFLATGDSRAAVVVERMKARGNG